MMLPEPIVVIISNHQAVCLNLHGDICQLFLNKTEGKKRKKNVVFCNLVSMLDLVEKYIQSTCTTPQPGCGLVTSCCGEFPGFTGCLW